MTAYVLTSHARERLRQRRIPPVVIDWLIDFGAEKQQDGATVRYLDKRSRRRLATYTGGITKQCEHLLDTCVVIGRQNQIITAFFRDRRVKGK